MAFCFDGDIYTEQNRSILSYYEFRLRYFEFRLPLYKFRLRYYEVEMPFRYDNKGL